jgi:acetolactate synthase-1/2/3 large subunit
VLVHVDAGTANACMAIQNMFRYRLPVLLFAGRAPHTLHGELVGSRDAYVHFVQDPFDIASIVRPYVKWEYSLPSGVVVKEAMARAAAFAHSDPPGPVYMMLPRETLAEEWDEAAMPSYPPTRYGSVQAGGIEPARVEAIADALMRAENPVAFAAYVGRKPHAVAALDRLARTCGIRVGEFSSIDLNIPQDSPCYAGSDPLALLESADLGLLLDTDVLCRSRRAAALKWTRSIDPLKSDFPGGFATDIRAATAASSCNRFARRSKSADDNIAAVSPIASRLEGLGRDGAEARRRRANKGVAGAQPAFVRPRQRRFRRMTSCSTSRIRNAALQDMEAHEAAKMWASRRRLGQRRHGAG